MKLQMDEQEQIALIYDVAYNVHQESPYDAAHDWEHHRAVRDNGLEIIRRENISSQIEMTVFVAASLFHDLERGSKEHNLAVEKMHEAGFDFNFLDRMVDLINEHSFGDTQKSLAGTVLWAADKIEYVSKDRYQRARGKLGYWPELIYKMTWKSRIKKVISKLNDIEYKSPIQMFSQKFNELVTHIRKENPSDLVWFKGLI